MKIVVATSAPFFWQPQVECLAEAMRAFGHETVVATCQSVESLKGRQFDLLFCLGTWESLRPFLDGVAAHARMMYLIESIPTPTESDDYTRSKLDTHRAYLQEFDCILVHTRRSIPTLQALGVRRVGELLWPHFPTIFRPVPAATKDIDVLFFGNPSPYRKRIIGLAAQKFRVSIAQNVLHGKLPALLGRAKVVLNVHRTPLRNFECRVAETLGCEAFLLTEPLDPDDVLRDGEHLAVFCEENLHEQIGRYLEDQDGRERIARDGCAEIQKYSVQKQVEKILRAVGEVVGI